MENDSIKQYVSNINGYYVKDAEAHESLSSINETLDNTYNKDEVDAIAETKADAGNTLSDYNINDAYTKTEVDNKIQAFNLTIFETPTNVTTSAGTITWNTFNVAKNIDGSIAKVYGGINIGSLSSETEVTVSFMTSLRPETDIVINDITFVKLISASSDTCNCGDITIKTTGEVSITFATYTSTTSVWLRIHPCLLFITDFGDTPTPDA